MKYYSPKKSVTTYKDGVADTVTRKPFDEMRRRLLVRAEAKGLSLKELSQAINKNHAYMHQFVYRGSPQKLDEYDRAKIAKMLGIPEAEIGGPDRPDGLTLKTGELTEAQVRAALAPILVALGLDREFSTIAARALLKAIEAAQSLDPEELQDRDYEIAAHVVASELLQKKR